MSRPRKGWFWSIRARMVALALVSVTPLIVIYAIQSNDVRERGREDAQLDTLRLSRVAAERESATLERTRAVLTAATAVAQRDWTGADCADSLGAVQEQIQGASNVLVLDRAGVVACSAVPVPAGTDLSDRYYVKDAAELGHFVAETELPGPVVDEPELMATLPLGGDAAGSIIGAIDIGTDLNGFLSRNGLPDGTTVTIIDDGGHVLSSTLPENRPGDQLPVQGIVDQVVAGSAEGIVEAKSADGMNRIYGYADIPGTNQTAFAAVGVPREIVFADADAEGRTSLIAGIIVALVAVIVALLLSELSVARPVHALVATVRKLGAGDLDARTGARVKKGEMGELSQSIDEMAGDLQERDVRLRESADEREDLLNELLNAQEAERARIAADIHDDTIQTMIAAGMQVQLLRRHLDGDEAEETCQRVEHTITASVARLRQLMFELEPPAAEAGLADTIEWYLEGVLAASPLDIDVETDGTPEPAGVARHVFFRNLREAALNAARHGGADHLQVDVRPQDGGIAVGVVDDGSGFDTSQAPPADHHGLRTMRERTEALGGHFTVESAPAEGTTVSFWLPGELRTLYEHQAD
jgi:signal transduction histidine kinase